MSTATARAPFLDFNSFTVAETALAQAPSRLTAAARSPFLSAYESSDGEASYPDPVREAYASLVNELHDEEFDEALFELQCRARAMHDGQLAAGKPRAEADRLVAQHFSPLIEASEAAVDSMAREFVPRELGGIVDHEIDSFVDGLRTRARRSIRSSRSSSAALSRRSGARPRLRQARPGEASRRWALGPFFNQIKACHPAAVQARARTRPSASCRSTAATGGATLGAEARLCRAPRRRRHQRRATDADRYQRRPCGRARQCRLCRCSPPPVTTATSPQQELNEHIAAALLAQDEVELELESGAVRQPSGGAAPRPAFRRTGRRARALHRRT